jgi:hypothetical protein
VESARPPGLGPTDSGPHVTGESDDSRMHPTDMFNAKGGDGSSLELPRNLWPRRSRRNGDKRAPQRTFYHKNLSFKLPTGSTVHVILVITTQQKWEAKMEDKSGWTVIPFLKNWVVVLQLKA